MDLIFVFRNCANAPKMMTTRCSCTPLSKSPRGFTIKVKVNWFFTMPWRCTGEQTCSSTLSGARTWMKMSGQLRASAKVHLRKKNPRHPLNSRLGGPHHRSERFALPGLEARTVQPVAYSLNSTASCPDCRNLTPLKETYLIFQFVLVLYTNTNGLRYQFTNVLQLAYFRIRAI